MFLVDVVKVLLVPKCIIIIFKKIIEAIHPLSILYIINKYKQIYRQCVFLCIL